MQAIKTKYSGPTNFKGSKITASCEAGKVHFSYDYSLNIDENHRAACKALLKKLGWDAGYYSEMVGGQHGDSMFWVFNGGSSLSTKGD
jgi:hypothetical protein